MTVLTRTVRPAAAWDDFWTTPVASRVRRPGSDLARRADALLPPGEPVADLGCGNGRDAAYLSRHGRPVLAYDVAGAAVELVRAKARRQELELRARRLDLADLGAVLGEGAELARTPYHLYARQLVGCLDATGRSNLWLLARMALRGSGLMVLELSATGPSAQPGPEGLVRRVDPAVVRREVGAAGGRVECEEVGPGVDLLGRPDPRVCRMVLSWPAPAGRR